MARKNRIITSHHIVPKHLGGSNHPDNIIKINNIKHQALHTLLDRNGTPLAPIEQMAELFRLISKPIVENVKMDIENILNLYKSLGMEVYKIDTYKK